MSEYRFTPQAADDLFAIWSYIAEGSPEAADRVEEAVYAACAFVAEAPLAGRIREDLTALPVRFWLVQPFRNCWIVYDPKSKPLQIIRILHPARNIVSILS
ncbi:MAG TPA: type II toxin-antitoxin system RelE/ParE family toxin [Candidatus Acidoferrum sp.]|nr:type II toxin-antitoxin system RelE/ParE family toxin [Candidatus Acidoferrum sp.]